MLAPDYELEASFKGVKAFIIDCRSFWTSPALLEDFNRRFFSDGEATCKIVP